MASDSASHLRFDMHGSIRARERRDAATVGALYSRRDRPRGAPTCFVPPPFFLGGRLARSLVMRRSRRADCELLSPRFSLGLSFRNGLVSLRNSTDTGVAN